MRRHLIGYLMVLACVIAEILSYPASNNEVVPLHIELNEEANKNSELDKKSLHVPVHNIPQDAITKEILEKIKIINDAIKKPHRRQQIKWNPQPSNEGGYIIDKEILEKLQEIIASGKLHGLPHNEYADRENVENSNDIRSRQMNLPNNPLPIPYITNIPVMVVPSGINPNYMNSNGFNQLRDVNGNPGGFQFQWPFAQVFPILIRDPVLSVMNGGGWNHFIEYGQSADICRKQKSVDENVVNESVQDDNNSNSKQERLQSYDELDPSKEIVTRLSRSLKKRTVSQDVQEQEMENTKNNIKTLTKKPATTKRPAFSFQQLQHLVDPGSKDDVRFGWFNGNNNNNNPNNNNVDQRIPVEIPTPGFFINRLRVRKGGVAIAGPGGVATAGRGGTAIVGPGGTALTQPGGMAVAGPAARVIALSSDADLSSIIKNIHQQQAASDGSVLFKHDIPEGRLVATGPVVYYHPKQSLREREWGSFDRSYRKSWQWNNYGQSRDEFQYDGRRFYHGPLKQGKSGFRAVQYLPFYGGAKGQYLEIKKDTRGTVLSEKIVSQDKLSVDYTKYSDENENVLIRILAKNLYNLKHSSSDLLKLVNVGRKTGSLSNHEKTKFKNELASIGEAVANIIKVMDGVGDNYNSLFKRNDTYSNDDSSHHHNEDSYRRHHDSNSQVLKEKSLRRFKQQFDDDEDDVGEEGIGVDADSGIYDDDDFDSSLIAEAKPVGLAVIGRRGQAFSGPVGTAVAASGVAIARPVGTAIAGINPQVLGINYQLNPLRRHLKLH